MEILKKYLFLIIFLVLAGVVFIALIIYGSQIEEIKPGEGFTSFSRKVNVQADNPIWTDPGIFLSELKTKNPIKVILTGSVSLCNNQYDYQLDAAYSSVTNDYKNSANIFESGNLTNYNPFNTNTITGIVSNTGLYSFTSSSVRLSKYDTLEFQLKPKSRFINSCQNIPSDIIFGNTLGANLEQCDQMGVLGSDMGNIINNDPSPEGNKLVKLGSTTWIVGADSDFRLNRDPGIDNKYTKDDLSSINCNNRSLFNNLRKNSTFDLNTKCQTFVRDSGQSTGQAYSYFFDSTENQAYAELLIANIYDISSSSYKLCLHNNQKGTCSSSGGSVKSRSLKLNHKYVLDTDYTPSQVLVIGLNFNGNDTGVYTGGYNVIINHECRRVNGQSLFLYISETEPAASAINNSSDPNLFELNTANSDGEIDLTSILSGYTNLENKKIFLMIKDNGDGYANNTGNYTVEFEIESIPSLITDIMDWLLGPIKDFFGRNKDSDGVYQNGVIKDFYTGLLDSGIRSVVNAILVLFITFLSLGFSIGVIEMKFNELFKLIMKAALVLTLTTDMSWNFLNKNFFNLFWFGSEYLVKSYSRFFGELNSHDFGSIFIFFDKSVAYIFNWHNLVRYLSLICGGFFNPLNWLIAVIIAKGLVNIVSAFLMSIILYVSAIIASGFLIAVSPIFLCFILFKTTFQYFDTWLKQLIMYTTVPAIFFIIIGFLNEILFLSIYQIFSFGVYKECVLPITFLPGLDLCILSFPIPFANSSMSFDMDASYPDMVTSIIPISFMHLITFAIVSKFYLIIISCAGTLGSMIFGGSPQHDLTDVAKTGEESMKYLIGMDQDSIERRRDNRTKLSTVKPSENTNAKNNPNIGAGFK